MLLYNYLKKLHFRFRRNLPPLRVVALAVNGPREKPPAGFFYSRLPFPVSGGSIKKI
jgi:hypothetical protein